MKLDLFNKKIAFCITCMNRLQHIQKTLIKNIENNFQIDNVEFILLDYNSVDGLEEWVKEYLKKYISLGVLKYYKTTSPQYYQRAHSRNMAFYEEDPFLDNECINCNVFPICGGGCPLDRINNKNKEKNYCSFYKTNIANMLPHFYKQKNN